MSIICSFNQGSDRCSNGTVTRPSSDRSIISFIPGALQQVVPEKESPKRMLDPATHLHQVSEDVPARVLVGLDVDQADSDEEVPVGTGQGFLRTLHLRG